MRAVDDPSRVRWSGTSVLPATQAAYSIGRSVVLRGEDGVVTVFQPSGEVVWEAGSVPPEARWIAAGDGGAFVWGNVALVVDSDAARKIESENRVVWAAPASGDRVVVLSQSDGQPQLEVWEPGDTGPTSVRPVESTGPILLTARGREIILPGGEDGRMLIGRTLPELEPAERTRLDAPPVVLATSPSEHRLFAASNADPRLVTIDRYGWRTLGHTPLDAPARELRPGVTGELVLVFDGARAWAVRAGETNTREVVGEWRIDLPLGLPGGRILTAAGGVIRWLEAEGPESEAVDGPEDAWWLPVRWTPRRIEPLVLPPTATRTAAAADTAPGEVAQMQRVGLTTMGRVAGRAVPEATFPRGPPAGGEVVAFATVPAGFYAVATSSRRTERLTELRRSLEGSGYSTHILTRRDEAHDLWYRLLVGPYTSRPEAEAAASSLQRERGISAWIHEVIGGVMGGVR